MYARVSTERQEREKTIESQLEELRKVCEQNGVEVVKEYIDNGWSGSTLARPALDKLRDDASKGLFEAVYIHSPDRLARRYIYQALVIEELRKKGIEVIFLNKPVTDNPEDQLLLGMQGLIAEYERAKILERTRRGRFHKARNGSIMGGTAPYGYDYVKKTSERDAYYKINPEEAEIVKLIFSLYLKHKSTSKVVKELDNRKIKPRGGGRFWSKGVIHRILCNECYIGNAYYNKLDKSGKKRKLRERSEWILIKIPPIISKETFQLVQEILKNHKGGKKTRIYLLSGLVKCKDCGSKYIGLSTQRKYYFYRCGNFVKRFPLPKNCNARPVKAEKLENAVFYEIQKAILRPDILIHHILNLAKNINSNEKDLEKTKMRLINKKERLENKKKKILDVYLEELISKNEYIEKKKEIESKERELEKEIAEINDRISNKIDKSLIIRNINYFSDLAKERLKNLSPEEVQEFLRYLIEEIIFDSHNKYAKIIGYIPVIERNLSYENLFQIALALRGETWNKNLSFELEVKV